MENNINTEIESNISNIEENTFKDLKDIDNAPKTPVISKQKVTLGIRTTEDIKRFFEQDIEGSSADEKIRKLKLAYEKIKDQENTYKTGITDYIRNIENILSSVNVQLVAIDNLFCEKERQMKDEYAEFIGKELKSIQNELDDREELNSKIEYLNKENKNLSSNIKEKETKVIELNEKNTKLLKLIEEKENTLSKLKLENSDLLRKVTTYMEQNQAKDAEFESKIEEINNSFKDLEISNSVKEHKINELEKERASLKEELKVEKEEHKLEIKELNKEYKDEIKELREIIEQKNLEIENLNKKIFELQLKK